MPKLILSGESHDDPISKILELELLRSCVLKGIKTIVLSETQLFLNEHIDAAKLLTVVAPDEEMGKKGVAEKLAFLNFVKSHNIPFIPMEETMYLDHIPIDAREPNRIKEMSSKISQVYSKPENAEAVILVRGLGASHLSRLYLACLKKEIAAEDCLPILHFNQFLTNPVAVIAEMIKPIPGCSASELEASKSKIRGINATCDETKKITNDGGFSEVIKFANFKLADYKIIDRESMALRDLRETTGIDFSLAIEKSKEEKYVFDAFFPTTGASEAEAAKFAADLSVKHGLNFTPKKDKTSGTCIVLESINLKDASEKIYDKHSGR